MTDREARALQSAKAALKGHIDKSYKFVVLHNPNRNDYLVYALAMSRNPDDVVFGIHYRITVSSDGNKVDRADALSRRKLIIIKGADTASLWTTHLVSATPIETHVYLSLLHSMPVYVGTLGRAIWKVQEGKISRTRPAQR